jgi:hypothetical protein
MSITLLGAALLIAALSLAAGGSFHFTTWVTVSALVLAFGGIERALRKRAARIRKAELEERLQADEFLVHGEVPLLPGSSRAHPAFAHEDPLIEKRVKAPRSKGR